MPGPSSSSRFRLALVLFLGILAPALAAPFASPAPVLLLQDLSGPGMDAPALADFLGEGGLRARHEFPGAGAILDLPPGFDLASLPPGLRLVRAPSEARALRAGAPPEVRRALAVFEALTTPRPPDTRPLPEPIRGDAEVPPPGATAARGPRAVDACGLGPNPTSPFLYGKIAIVALFPESAGAENTEDWANPDPALPPVYTGMPREDVVLAEIAEGLDRLAAEYPGAGLSFVYESYPDLPVSVEPIAHEWTAQATWMNDSFRALGKPGVSFFADSRAMIDEARERHGADFGTVVFTVDSLNDPDGMFLASSRFAYAYLGGPLLVMTWDNDGWGITRTDSVLVHELGHNFLALDEYRSAGNECTDRAGLLGVENQNNDSPAGCLSSVRCEMRANWNSTVKPFCEWTEGQVGLRDSDADGIPDLLDYPPDTSLDPVSPDPTPLNTFMMTGRATTRLAAGENPWTAANVPLTDVTLVEWRLDGGAWISASAEDGAFDSRCEPFTVPLVSLSEGWHEVEVRATDAFGTVETSTTSDRFYVDTDCPPDGYEPNDSAPAARAIPGGTHAGLGYCAFDEDWYSVTLRAGSEITATIAYDPAEVRLFLELRDPGGSLRDRSDTGSGTEVVSATGVTAGRWTLRVAADAEEQGAYTLQVDALCVDDPWEPADDAAGAAAVGAGALADLQLCQADEDWYSVSIAAGGSVTAEVLSDPALGDLDLELYGPDLTRLGGSSGPNPVESVTGGDPGGGVHYARVFGAGPGVANRYDLDLSVAGCEDDRHENNDDETTAALLGGGRHPGLRLCPGEEDWYRVTIPAESLAQFHLTHNPASGDLDLEVRDPSGRLLGRSASGANRETVNLEGVAGDVLVRVHSQHGAGNTYGLEAEFSPPVLLFVRKEAGRGPDVILDWTDPRQDCITLLRSDNPADWSGAWSRVLAGVDDAAPAQSYRDRNRVGVTTLDCYLIEPSECGVSFVRSTKTVEQRHSPPGTAMGSTWTIRVENTGTEDATDVTVRDDMPLEVQVFTVVSFPPGATDNSSPTGGANGRGYVEIAGLSVPAGGSAEVVVSFTAYPTSNVTKNDYIVSNQAEIFGTDSAGVPFRFLTDDPETRAPGDPTDFYLPNYRTGNDLLAVSAFWNRPINVDLRLIDPCGNPLSRLDPPPPACPAGSGLIGYYSDCGTSTGPGIAEEIRWSSPAPASGATFTIQLAYTGDDATDPTCGPGGEDDVYVWVRSWALPDGEVIFERVLERISGWQTAGVVTIP